MKKGEKKKEGYCCRCVKRIKGVGTPVWASRKRIMLPIARNAYLSEPATNEEKKMMTANGFELRELCDACKTFLFSL